MKRAADGMNVAAEFLVDHGIKGEGGIPCSTNSQWAVPCMYWLFTEYLVKRRWTSIFISTLALRCAFAAGAEATPPCPIAWRQTSA